MKGGKDPSHIRFTLVSEERVNRGGERMSVYSKIRGRKKDCRRLTTTGIGVEENGEQVLIEFVRQSV